MGRARRGRRCGIYRTIVNHHFLDNSVCGAAYKTGWEFQILHAMPPNGLLQLAVPIRKPADCRLPHDPENGAVCKVGCSLQ